MSDPCTQCKTFRQNYVGPLKVGTLSTSALTGYTGMCERCFNQEIAKCNQLQADLNKLAATGDKSLNYTPAQIQAKWKTCLNATDPTYKAKELGKTQLQRRAAQQYTNANKWNAQRILSDAPQVPLRPVAVAGAAAAYFPLSWAGKSANDGRRLALARRRLEGR